MTVEFLGWKGDYAVTLDCACGWQGTVTWDVDEYLTAACPMCAAEVLLETERWKVEAARQVKADADRGLEEYDDLFMPADPVAAASGCLDGFEADWWRAGLTDAGWTKPAETPDP